VHRHFEAVDFEEFAYAVPNLLVVVYDQNSDWSARDGYGGCLCDGLSVGQSAAAVSDGDNNYSG